MQGDKNEVNSSEFEIRPASSEKAGLLYALLTVENEQLGRIGHVHMGFGKKWQRVPAYLVAARSEGTEQLCEALEELRS